MSQEDLSPLSFFEDEEQAAWIVTFADLVTLLLVFFILLYAISSLNLEKFKYAMQSIQVSLGEKYPPMALLQIAQTPPPSEKKISLEEMIGLKSREEEMLKDIDSFIKEKKLNENILLLSSQGKIMIQIKGAVLFKSGRAALQAEAEPIMNEIVKIIDDYSEYSVNIKGHTDDRPILTKEFPSNWELSSIRATTVLKYLIQGGIDPGRLTATGYSDLLPLVPNNTPENRAINRRVEFVLEKKKGPF